MRRETEEQGLVTGGIVIIFFLTKAGNLIKLMLRKSGELNGKVEKNTTFHGAMKLKVELV